jgi:8-oxo-dGTP diphosphatase
MSHELGGGKLKVVQFWRMRATGGPVRELMRDVKAVKWLPLDQAIGKLSHAHERVFLANVGPVALAAARIAGDDAGAIVRDSRVEADTRSDRMSFVDRIRAWLGRTTGGG